MDIELVYDADCPNVDRARTALRQALARVGSPAGWRERLQTVDADPAQVRYPSPTILIDGIDAFAMGAGEAAGCRLYVNGSPPLAELVAALEEAGRRAAARLEE